MGQDRGLILKKGDAFLNPTVNGDEDYITLTGQPFSNDGYYVDEFELPMFGIPISETGEVLNDIQAGAACGTTDLAIDTAGFAAYGLLDNFGNLIFRFRLAGDRPSVEAYTVLIDTDGLFGDSDPNQTPDNPGFEIDITLIKGKRVAVFNLDGQDGCPAEILTYDIDTHYQKSIAGTESCDDADFFYDFYVPLGDLITEFNIGLETEMQFFAVTNVSATCALGGKISDVGGVDDTEFDGCNVCAFTTLSESQCPTALNDLCGDCGGFSLGSTPRPEINAPLKVGETEITGTAEPGADIFIDVYDAADVLIDQDTTLVDVNGDWLAMLANPLAIQDSVTARAQVEGLCTSGISESDLSFAIVVLNEPPVLSGSGTILDYTENDGQVPIDNNILIVDIDDTEIDGASITLVQNYTPAEDLIVFNDQSGITGSFDTGTATLTLTGKATLAEYSTALASITYENTSETPDTSPRQVSFVVNDGLDDSNIIIRVINIISVNDPPVIAGSAIPLLYTNGDGSVVIDNTINITDVDDSNIESATVTITINYVPAEDFLNFSDQNGITGGFDSASGVLSLTGSATLANYTTALASVEYEKTGISSIKTRSTTFIVFDGTDNSAGFISLIDISGVNQAPVIVDDGNDTIFVSTNEDTLIDICLIVNDPDDDLLAIDNLISTTNNGTVDLNNPDPLCFSFTPDADFNGLEILQVTVCDQITVDSKCDNVVIVIDVLPVNDPPEILLNGQPIDTLNISTLEDTPVETCLDAEDIDGDDLDVTYGASITGNGIFDVNPLGDLCFNFIPNPDFNGQEIGVVAVCDNGVPSLCDTVVVVADVIPVNDPPVFLDPSLNLVDTLYFTTNEDTNFGICIDAEDPDVEDVEIVDAQSLTGNAIISLSISNALCYTFIPNLDFNGREVTRIIGCDQGNPALCDTVFVVVDILPVNDPPVISIDTLNLFTDEDIPINFCLDVNDPDNPTLELADLVSTGNGVFSSSSSNPFCFDFVPNENFNGSDVATISICDGESPALCDTVIVIIDVLPVNDPPVAIDDTIRLLRNRSATKDLMANDSDIDGDNITIDQTLESLPLHGSVDINLDGTVTYTPTLAFFGEDSFSYQICDDGNPSLCSAANVLIEVENVDLIVYQAVSPNGDGINDFWEIKEIGFFGDNLVRLFDRYNNIIFEMSGYNNDDRVWVGQSNEGLSRREVPDGTYFYIINLGDGSKIFSGFVVLKRE